MKIPKSCELVSVAHPFECVGSIYLLEQSQQDGQQQQWHVQNSYQDFPMRQRLLI